MYVKQQLFALLNLHMLIFNRKENSKLSSFKSSYFLMRRRKVIQRLRIINPNQWPHPRHILYMTTYHWHAMVRKKSWQQVLSQCGSYKTPIIIIRVIIRFILTLGTRLHHQSKNHKINCECIWWLLYEIDKEVPLLRMYLTTSLVKPFKVSL